MLGLLDGFSETIRLILTSLLETSTLLRTPTAQILPLVSRSSLQDFFLLSTLYSTTLRPHLSWLPWVYSGLQSTGRSAVELGFGSSRPDQPGSFWPARLSQASYLYSLL